MNDLLTLSYEILPGEDYGNRIYSYNDRGWKGGKSIIKEFTCNAQGIVFDYVLKEGASSPLVFFTLFLKSSYNPVNISRYDSVSIRINEATNKRIMIFIKTFVPDVSMPEPEKGHTLRHNQYILQLAPDTHLYTIKLNKFITPPWWTNMMNVDISQIAPESYKKVVSFDMQFNIDGSNYVLDKEEYIRIENISFQKSMSVSNIIIAGILVFYYSGLTIFLITGKSKEITELPLQKPIEVSTHREKELERIRDFIESNYTDEHISTRMVYEKLGIPPLRVFNLLKEEYNLSFKQLINQMRIKEAKRLLKETDLRIIEIALQLGFNNISYFNNLFKMYEKQTPSDYRKREKE